MQKSYLLLLFFLFTLVSPEDYTLNHGEGRKFGGKGNNLFTIQLNGDTFDDYIALKFSSEGSQNPLVYISKDESCTNERLFISTQLVDPIYIFFAKNQIADKFSICIKYREDQIDFSDSNYTLEIVDTNQVTLPYNTQGSYYILDESNTQMKFYFSFSEVQRDSEITFWVKGKSINQVNLNYNFNKSQIDNGYIFYGTYEGQNDFELTVEANISDYITIGSTIISNGITKDLKDNANEMVIASNKDVCVPINNSYSQITGKIYTKRARLYFADKNKNVIVHNDKRLEKNVTNGIISTWNLLGVSEEYNKGYFCFENIDNKLMIFSSKKTNYEAVELYNPPIIPGEIQHHFLMKGQIAIFYGMKPDSTANETNLNLKALKGFPEMYYDECKTFPECYYTNNTIQKLAHPYPSNMITTYSFYLNESNRNYEPISTYQPLMIVYCGEGGKVGIFKDNFFCEFETTYFTNKDLIYIYEGETFSQFLDSSELDSYKISFGNDKPHFINFDLLIFSGDADIFFESFNTSYGIVNKYYLSNKIFCTIDASRIELPESIVIRIKANKRTFYMVQYKTLGRPFEHDDDISILESGINYITSKDFAGALDHKPKRLKFLNFKKEFKYPYLVTFYSPNCLFDIDWEKNEDNNKTTESIAKNTYKAQKIIDSTNDGYGDQFNFYYTIDEDKDSMSRNPLTFCMVYAAGLELSNSTEDWNGRSISLSEGVPHRYIFTNEHPFIIYSYHVSDPNNKMVINFNLIDKNYFDIFIYVNGNYLKNATIYRNGILFVTQEDLQTECEQDEVCTVDVKINMHSSRMPRRVEITMYQIDANPFYLEKNVVKQDVLIGNMPKHYYFEISDLAYGDITLDFKRGSGNIFATVEKIDLLEPMSDPDWRGQYHFPEFIHESLKYDTYGKKILITEESTRKCNTACYVLITIESNVRYKGPMTNDEETPFRISINPRIVRKDTNYPSPKVRIGVNDLIIGNIMYGLPENRKYDYYSVILPFESEQILIDWQADSPSLIINVGSERPTKDDADFSFPTLGKDFVYILNRTDIIEKGGYKNNTFIRDGELTIGVYSDVSDSITSSPYAFKILMPPHVGDVLPPPPDYPSDSPSDFPSNSSSDFHSDFPSDEQPPSPGFPTYFPSDFPSDEQPPPPPVPLPYIPVMHLIHIRSDQKVQCLPFIYKNESTCLFAVIVDDMDINSNIIAYPRSQSGYKVTIYGNLFESENIERNNGEVIIQYVEEIFKNNNYKQSQSYVYIENVTKSYSYLFMTTANNTGDIIEVLSSSFHYYNDMDLYPNPSTAQIFSIGDFNINLKFSTTRDLLVNIACLTGNGSFFWQNEENKKFYLNGLNDRLSLTTYTEIKDDKLSSLKVNPENNFIFIITYYPRSNIDQLKTERTTEFHYRSVNMPLSYYAPITIGQEWAVNFNFYEIGLKNTSSLVYDTNLFTIWATIISEETARNARFNPMYRPIYNSSCIKGIYDSTFGMLYLDVDKIDKLSQNINGPNLFFSIEKNPLIREDFSTIDMEIDIHSDYKTHIQKGIFISGKLFNTDRKQFLYFLDIDKGEQTLVIQYAANSDSVKFVLKTGKENDKNIEKVKYIERSGFNLMTLDLEGIEQNTIFLIVSPADNNLREELSHFIFRYDFGYNEEDYIPFTDQSKMNLEISETGNNYQINFYPIPKEGTTYYIKAYFKNGFIDGEKIDTIATSESPGEYIQINNISSDADSQVSYNLTTEKRVNYIKVMAVTIKDNKKNYYLYNTSYVYKAIEPYNLGINRTTRFVGYGNNTYYIRLNETKKEYRDYFILGINKTEPPNPFIYLAKDEDCMDRLFTVTQANDYIYAFVKNDQIDKDLYICVKERQNSNNSIHVIYVFQAGRVVISFNSQVTYYVSNDTMKNVELVFDPDNIEGEELTVWVKGKNIINADISECNKTQIENGYIFNGTFTGNDVVLSVEANVGDYITIGSTVVKNNKTEYLKENANEIFIAANHEICLPLKATGELSFITGKIYTKRASTCFTDKDGKILQKYNQESEIKNINDLISEINLISISSEVKEGYYCINNTDNELMIFSIQLIKYNSDLAHIFLPPMLPGDIQRYYLPIGHIAIFHGSKPDDDYSEMNFNIKSLKGFPGMYYEECKTFPYCYYTKDIIQKLTHPYPSNMATTYSFYKEEVYDYNPISTSQPLMIVYCGLGGKIELFGESTFCEFEATYFTNKDTIKLYPDSSFSQYLYQNETDKYKINLKNDNISLIYLDLLLFSGDADIILPDPKIVASKYYLSNKIFYSISFGSDDKPDSLEFNVNATEKTFYMVQYKLLERESSNDFNTLESGINYITSKHYNPSQSVPQTEKHLQFLNFKYEYKQMYLVTFYSPNCLFDIYWVKNNSTPEGIANDTYTTQRLIEPNNGDYYAEKFEFYYTIKKDDDSQYPIKFCMVYAAGLELNEDTEPWNERSISLSEGVPHRYIFNQVNHFIAYSYHVSDTSKDLILNFNLIDKEYFDINVDINKKKDVIIATIYRNKQITIKKKEFIGRCVEYEVCTVDVRIRMRPSDRGRELEFTMYQLDKTPFYLQKNVVKQDILNGNIPKHYYFDIGNNEYGDITLDFKRGSGNIYASVQSRNLDTLMDAPEWRGMYHFPTTIEESLKYDIYGKKILIHEDSTSKCEYGCYVLITIVSNAIYYGLQNGEETPFRISINPRIIRKDTNYPSPKVRINVNDFIIGNIMYDLPENRKYDYYSVILPYESELIIIDWQADSPSFVINVGEGKDRPTKEICDFPFPSIGRDYVYVMNKTDILTKAGITDNNNMRNLELTIGVYSDVSDSITSSPYAFKIFLPHLITTGPPPLPPDAPRPPDVPQIVPISPIIHIRSDQKVQCLPFEFGEVNICAFAVIVDDYDIRSNIIVYPRSQYGSDMEIYGKLVNAEEIERNNEDMVIIDYIKDVYRNEDYKQTEKYIYIKNVAQSESFFFVVVQNGTNDIIEVLSSAFFMSFNYVNYSPNPSTPQIFAIGDHEINLRFSTTRNLLINIACVAGRGKFYWEDNPNKEYYLSGYEDRLSLTSDTDVEENKLSLLKVKSDTYDEYNRLIGGFIFIVTYYPRGYVDQLKKDRSTEFHYRTVHSHLYYFVPISIGNDWIINLNFYDMCLKDNSNLEYDTNLFNIWATIISDETALKGRYDPEYRPDCDDSSYIVQGIYDSSFGMLYLSQKKIEELSQNNHVKSRRNIFFSIENQMDDQIEFSTMGLEINIYSNNETDGLSEVPERIFISGKLSNSKDNRLVYHLKLDKKRLYLAIQYSANSNLIKFALSTNPDSKDSDLDNIEYEKNIGINLMYVQLNEYSFPENGVYFIVYTNEPNINNKLDYFTFGYFITKAKDNFSILSEDKTKLTVEGQQPDYKIGFYPIPLNGTSYYIKAYYKEGFTEGENIETIAISESPGKYMQINDPSFVKDEQLYYTLSTDKEIKCIKVYARLTVDEYNIYNLYKPEFINNDDIPSEIEENVIEHESEIDNNNEYQNEIETQNEEEKEKEDHGGSESHDENESHSRSESHEENESHSGSESHEEKEDHGGSESHEENESHRGSESHEEKEDHGGSESHEENESHRGSESHEENENDYEQEGSEYKEHEKKNQNETKPSNNTNNPEDNNGDKKTDATDDSDKVGVYVLIGVSSFLFIVVIILIVFVFVYKKRNQNLLDNVNKISFLQSGSQDRDRETGNLLLEDDK